jgi:ribonuclease PH
MSPFSIPERKSTGRYDKKSKEITFVLNHVLESIILTSQLSRSQIDVNFTVIEADGGSL